MTARLASLREDEEARILALDPRVSIALQAPAGSGKTTVLTQRILALLAVVEEPEAVLAVTFTRKAAAEMRSRVLSALERAAKAEPIVVDQLLNRGRPRPNLGAKAVTLALAVAAWQRCEQLGWGLLENPARLRIQTIDGLNHRLATAMPISARGVAQLQLADELTPLYREAARRCLLDAEHDHALNGASQQVFLRLNNEWERLESLLASMLASRSSWQRALVSHGHEGLQAQIAAALESARNEAVDRLRQRIADDRLQEGLLLLRHSRDVLGLEPLAAPETAEFVALQALAELALLKAETPAIRTSVNKSQGFPTDNKVMKQRVQAWLAALAELDVVAELDELRSLPAPTGMGWDAEGFRALAELLRLALAELQVLFTERGLVDHTTVANLALGALESGALQEWTVLNGERLQHILVDEFQDTSVDQLQLLAALTRDWRVDDGHSLFLVGDPMQSIYQFRDADVGLFGLTRRHGLGALRLVPLRLIRNFRSRPSVVAFVNETFSKIFPREDHSVLAAARYVPCIAGADASDQENAADGVQCHAVMTENGDGREAEAARVVQIVRETWALDPAASIAILIATRRHATHLVAALQHAGVAVQGVDLVPLAESPVVLDLMALTRALHDPADRIAWLALLRSPACGLALGPLTAWLEALEQQAAPGTVSDALRATVEGSLSHDPADGSPTHPLAPNDLQRLVRLWQALAPDLESRQPLAQRVERCWLRLNGPWCYDVSSVPEDARRYLDVLATHEIAGRWRGVQDFAWMLRGLYGASTGSSRESKQRVQIMTIHRAKGLEFDCVVLPGLARMTRSDSSTLLNSLRWLDERGHEAWIMAPIRAAHDTDDDPLLRWIKRKRRQRAANERIRVLYVAATRAKRWLHWIAEVDSTQPNPKKGTALAALWPALGESFSASPADIIRQSLAAQPEPIATLKRLPGQLPGVVLPADITVSPLTIADPAAVELRWRWAGGAARRAGTVVHRELERIALSARVPEDVEGFVAANYARWQAALHREGVSHPERDTMTRRVAEALSRCLSDPQGRWLLSEHPRENHVELPLTGWVAGELVNGVLDRCFIDEHGVRWVVDYKTTTHEGGNLEEFLAEQVRRYTPQMRRYVHLVSELGPEPVRAGLYFPWLQRFIELDGD